MKIVKKKNSTENQPKIVVFTAVKKRCMLHGRVFVMSQRAAIDSQANFSGRKL